jgi:hypothetical protein
MTIYFGCKCIECFCTFFSWLEVKSYLPWEIVYLWKANFKVKDLENLSVCLFVCFFIFFNLYCWICQEVYVHGICVGAMNYALKDLEWNALLMLCLEEWWIIYKLIHFLITHGSQSFCVSEGCSWMKGLVKYQTSNISCNGWWKCEHVAWSHVCTLYLTTT